MLNIILRDFQNKDNAKNEAIKKLENQKRSLRNNLTKKLIAFFTLNLDVKIDFSTLSDLSSKQKSSLLEKVLEVRGLSNDEISDDLLSLIEREKGKSKVLPLIFEKADDKLKLRIASFCSGYSTIGFQYEELEEYLFNEYNLENGYSKNANYIAIDGYNHELSAMGLKITTDKDNHDFLDSIVTTVTKLVDNGYKNQVIQIFERHLSLYDSYFLKIRDEDGELVVPEVITGSRRHNLIFLGTGENFAEQFKSCLEYIVKNLYYTGGEDENREY